MIHVSAAGLRRPQRHFEVAHPGVGRHSRDHARTGILHPQPHGGVQQQVAHGAPGRLDGRVEVVGEGLILPRRQLGRHAEQLQPDGRLLEPQRRGGGEDRHVVYVPALEVVVETVLGVEIEPYGDLRAGICGDAALPRGPVGCGISQPAAARIVSHCAPGDAPVVGDLNRGHVIAGRQAFGRQEVLETQNDGRPHTRQGDRRGHDVAGVTGAGVVMPDVFQPVVLGVGPAVGARAAIGGGVPQVGARSVRIGHVGEALVLVLTLRVLEVRHVDSLHPVDPGHVQPQAPAVVVRLVGLRDGVRFVQPHAQVIDPVGSQGVHTGDRYDDGVRQVAAGRQAARNVVRIGIGRIVVGVAGVEAGGDLLPICEIRIVRPEKLDVEGAGVLVARIADAERHVRRVGAQHLAGIN